MPSYVFFGYRDDSLIKSRSGSDGLIFLKSRLDLRKQVNAQKIYGFDTTHGGILNDEEVRRIFLQFLESVCGEIMPSRQFSRERNSKSESKSRLGATQGCDKYQMIQ